MSDKFFVLTEKDRRILDGLQRTSDAAPPPAMIQSQDRQYTSAPDVYWALPPCETGLPAAIRNSDGSISPGAAMCCLYKMDSESQALVPINDPLGLPFRAEVRNHYMRVANDIDQIWRHNVVERASRYCGGVYCNHINHHRRAYCGEKSMSGRMLVRCRK